MKTTTRTGRQWLTVGGKTAPRGGWPCRIVDATLRDEHTGDKALVLTVTPLDWSRHEGAGEAFEVSLALPGPDDARDLHDKRTKRLDSLLGAVRQEGETLVSRGSLPGRKLLVFWQKWVSGPDHEMLHASFDRLHSPPELFRQATALWREAGYFAQERADGEVRLFVDGTCVAFGSGVSAFWWRSGKGLGQYVVFRPWTVEQVLQAAVEAAEMIGVFIDIDELT